MKHTDDLANLKLCAEYAPEGTYEDAKALNNLIGETCDKLMQDIRSLGLKANNCDGIYRLEAAIYNYVKISNPLSTIFPVSEGFGESMNTMARDRVLSQTVRNRDFLAAIAKAEQ